MSGGRVFDRHGYPPVSGPPPPGTVLKPLTATRIAQAVTVLVVASALASILPNAATFAVAALAMPVAFRAYNAGVVRVEASGLVLRGLLRTRSFACDQVDSVDFWLLRWRGPSGRIRRVQLWPYAQFGVMWPGARNRSDEVIQSLSRLVESWKTAPPTP